MHKNNYINLLCDIIDKNIACLVNNIKGVTAAE